MNGFHEDFIVSVTDMSEMEPDMLMATICPIGKSCKTIDFYLHVDGSEEHIEIE